MKTNKRTWFTRLSCMMLAATVFAGCSSQQEAANPTNSNQPSENKEAVKQDEQLNLSIMARLHVPQVPKETVLNIIEEKTNTDLDIQWVPDNTYTEKLNTAIATGSLPKVVYVKQVDMNTVTGAVKAGMFWEIGPYLKDYPNLSKINDNVWNNTKIGGKIYGIPAERELSRLGVVYRKDWAENLGLQAPKTVDELHAMMEQFTKNDPDKNGKNDTIGLTHRNDLVYGGFKALSSYMGTPNNWGEDASGKLLPEFMHPEYMNTMKFMKGLYDEHMMNQDFAVASKVNSHDMFINGKAGVYIGTLTDAVRFQDQGSKLNPEFEVEIVNRIAGPKGEGIWTIPGFNGLFLIPKTSVESEDELKRILAFYDQMMTPEIANLVMWGVEGTHYEVVDGKAKWLVKDKKDLDIDVTPLLNLMVGELSSGKMKSYTDNPIRMKIDELVQDNNSILINDPTFPLESETNGERGLELKKMISDATFQFILGKIDEQGFQAAVDKWRSSGGDKIIEEYNAAYKK